MSDITDVTRVTYEVIQSVNAEIPLLGLGECCGTSIVRGLLDNYPEGAYLDGLSYHYYSPSGFNLGVALNRAAALAPYNRPIYMNEYGSRQYRSEGVNGALWHSWALTTLWEAGIAPLQYPVSEWPMLGEPYNSMGIFTDWRGDWERKPAYWVYANFFAHLGDEIAFPSVGRIGMSDVFFCDLYDAEVSTFGLSKHVEYFFSLVILSLGYSLFVNLNPFTLRFHGFVKNFELFLSIWLH